MNKVISTLSELIEQCSEANKIIISNAIAMEEGDLVDAQKDIREASNLLSTVLKDIFVEVKDILSTDTTDEESYELSVLDISKLLSKVCYNSASLISCYVNEYSDTIKANIETKLLKCINATSALVSAILLN